MCNVYHPITASICWVLDWGALAGVYMILYIKVKSVSFFGEVKVFIA